MIYQDLHGLAKRAVDRMRCMAERAEGDLTDFHERQLVHALFMELDALHPNLWAAFEYRYFNHGGWLKGKTDICALVNPTRAWLEVKSTGLNPEGWDNSHLGIWRHDLTKLLQVRDEQNTQIGWVWLFLFETYRSQVMTLGKGSAWTAPRKAGEVAPKFGRIDTGSGRLARSLHEVDLYASAQATSAIVSLIPQLPRAKDNVWEDRKEYSALLLTIDLSGSNPNLIIAVTYACWRHGRYTNLSQPVRSPEPARQSLVSEHIAALLLRDNLDTQ